ncbi:MAG TPA: M20/M25/M40 family metallo-hydrolase [Myxococcales bacterium]|nr:M20/M25/M40 family metallo-hydrolase [Myxococcales bacterium]
MTLRPVLLAVALALPAFAAPSLEQEEREILDELLRVDTSHGNETAAVKLVAARLEAAGVPVQTFESAPGRGNLVARLKGTGAKRPLILLAHLDVVPVDGQKWETPPFVPTERDGYLWARGVSDDKSMAAGFTAIVLEQARAHAKLSRDLVLMLTAGEETGGNAGVEWLTQAHRELFDADLALNEGGGLQLSPDSSRVQFVGIGAAEKTFQSFRLIARGKGGHSSIPPTDVDPAAELGRALVRVGAYRFPAHVLPVVKEAFAATARLEAEPLVSAIRDAAASAPRIAPQDEKVLGQDRIFNALIRTTCVTTMLQASPQDNVLPTTAEAVVNCRILPDETPQGTQAALAAAIDDPGIEVSPLAGFGTPGGNSPLEGEVTTAIRAATGRSFPGAAVAHQMGTGATDSRFLRAVGIAAYGIHSAPGTLDDARKGFGAHGQHERRPVKWLAPGVRFLRDVTLQVAR